MSKDRIPINSSFSGLLLILLLFFGLSKEQNSTYESLPRLNSNCPPGFKRNAKNQCIAVNLYQQYDSPNNIGVGGLRTGLPQIRDGFSPQEIDLGRYLFFDPILSGDGSMSCASCHDPKKGLSDGLATSNGNGGHKLKRAAPSLWNVGYLKKLFWDGRAASLEEQMKGPLFSKEEMNNTPENLLNTLNSIEDYKQLFAEAYPDRKYGKNITLNDIFTAIAAFESSLISLNSKYDQYAHGYHEALNENEIEGMNLFRSFVARCAECHTPPLFTNQQFAVIGTPEPDGLPFDPGAEVPSNDKTLRGAFKVPSLRNVERTAPYMHSGNFGTLRETVEFYTKGRGHAVPDNEDLIVHWHIWEPQLSDYELDRLVDFLKTLTDETFMPKIPETLPSGLKPSV
jgi:cytochrome c peroxidase